MKNVSLDQADRSRIIEMAWEDRTPFGAIETQFGCSESQVIKLMRSSLKPKSFRLWRERVNGRQTKHAKKAGVRLTRHVCPTQGKLS